MTVVDKALDLARHVAPDATVQEAFAQVARDMEGEGEPRDQIVLAICGGIVDGLR
jgi:hypothetical protein